MKQIKTVIRPLCEQKSYDETVNRLLSDGWTLIRRNVLSVPGELSEAFNTPRVSVLYAELEKEILNFEEITL